MSPKKHKVIVCGRRSGKTQMIAGELIRGGVLKLFSAQLLVAPTYKQTMIVFDKIIELMNKAGVYDDIMKATQSPHPKIIFKNNCFIDFGSADNPDSLRGFAYDRVMKDESAFIKKGADAAIKPLTYDKGAPVWETTTPWGKGDVWERWSRGMKGDNNIGVFHYNYKDNPYLSPDGVIEIEKDILEYGEDSLYVQAEIYGNFIEDRDVYFKREDIEGCISNDLLLGETNPKSLYYLGVDVAGMGEDESVFIVVERTRENNMRVNFIDFYDKNLPREIVGKIKILDEKYHFVKICMDKTGIGEGPEDWISEVLGDDGRVEGIRFTLQSKQDMYSNLKKIMGQGFKYPNHKKLIFQMMDLRYETTSSGDLKLHHSERGHDDYPDALALACWGMKEDEIETYTPYFK